MKKGQITAVVAGFLVLPSLARTFVTSGGGDLAAPGNWQGSALPTADETAVIEQMGTYTASADLTVRDVSFNVGGGNSATFDFTATPARRITLKAGSGKDGLSMGNNNRHPVFKGGIWDFNSSNFRAGNTTWTPNWGQDVKLTDGVVFTNVTEFIWADHANHDTACRTALDGAKTRVYAKGPIYNYATGHDASLIVTNGAQAIAGTYFSTDWLGGAASTTGRNKIVVAGAGSWLEAQSGTSYVGYTHPNNEVLVTDHAALKTVSPVWIGYDQNKGNWGYGNKLTVEKGATASLGSLYVGRGNSAQGAHDNSVRVNSDAEATFSNLILGGDNAATEGFSHGNVVSVDHASVHVTWDAMIGSPGQANRLELKNSARMDANSILLGAKHVCSSNNAVFLADSTLEVNGSAGIHVGDAAPDCVFVASNCTITAKKLIAGVAPAARRTLVRLLGRNSKYDILADAGTVNDFDFFNAGAEGRFELGDGASLTLPSVRFRMGLTSTGHVYRITGGATLNVLGQTTSIGNGLNSSFVRFELLDGATANLARFRMMSHDCELLIDNATMNGVLDGDNIEIGYRQDVSSAEIHDNRVTLRGRTPKMASRNKTIFINSSILHVVPPVVGYPDGHVPLTCKTFSLDATTTLSADVGAALAEAQQTSSVRLYTVAEATTAMFVPSSVLDAANARLPKGCSWRVVGNALQLRVSGRMGTLIIVR